MSIDDRPRHARPGPRPRQGKLSGCKLRHTVAECDCVRPEAAEPESYLCRACNGCGEVSTGVLCSDCRGWGEVRRYGDPVRNHPFPGNTNNADSVASIAALARAVAPTEDPDDPWATDGTVIDADPWTDPASFDPPF